MSSGRPEGPGTSLYSFRRKEEIAAPLGGEGRGEQGGLHRDRSGRRGGLCREPPGDGRRQRGARPSRCRRRGNGRRVVLSPPSRPEEEGESGVEILVSDQDGDRQCDRQHHPFFHGCPRSEKLNPPGQVDASLVKGMAPADPPDPVQAPQDRPVQADRPDRVLGAAGVEPAAVADVRGNRRLVQPQEADEEMSGPHGEPPSPPQRRRSAGSSSAHTEERTAPSGGFRTTIAVRVPRGKTPLCIR